MTLPGGTLTFQTITSPGTPTTRPIGGRIAKNCLYNPRQILASVPGSLALHLTFLRAPPWTTEPWKSIAEENNPGGEPTEAPLLITQGDKDPIVADGHARARAPR